MSYDPHSADAMFSRILQRLDDQDRDRSQTSSEFLKVLGEIRDEVLRTNGRVTGLERWRDTTTAKLAGISAGVSGVIALAGWLLSHS